MKNILPLFFACMLLVLNAISQSLSHTEKEKVKAEIIAIEKSFCDDLKLKGAAWAFHAYAANDAVIKRENDSLVIGKNAILHYYSKPMYQHAIANWKPDFTDVSDDGTMAYTYGKYTWNMKDAAGQELTFSGIFHTVWKKQADGKWKYVWD